MNVPIMGQMLAAKYTMPSWMTGPPRAGHLFVFLTQEILGAGRFLKVSEEELTSTIARLFLYGVTTRPAEGPAA